jgi:hypothetical protein
MPTSQQAGRQRLLTVLALVVLLATTLLALLWPREEVGRVFVEGGGNAVTYNDHLGLRLLIGAGGIVVAWLISRFARRPSD